MIPHVPIPSRRGRRSYRTSRRRGGPGGKGMSTDCGQPDLFYFRLWAVPEAVLMHGESTTVPPRSFFSTDVRRVAGPSCFLGWAIATIHPSPGGACTHRTQGSVFLLQRSRVENSCRRNGPFLKASGMYPSWSLLTDQWVARRLFLIYWWLTALGRSKLSTAHSRGERQVPRRQSTVANVPVHHQSLREQSSLRVNPLPGPSRTRSFEPPPAAVHSLSWRCGDASCARRRREPHTRLNTVHHRARDIAASDRRMTRRSYAEPQSVFRERATVRGTIKVWINFQERQFFAEGFLLYGL
jgi:hypothetical protein